MSEHKFGATGKYPRGKLHKYDEGELQMGIAHDRNYVHINFGKPVVWFSMSPEDTLKMASMMVEHAMSIKRGK